MAQYVALLLVIGVWIGTLATLGKAQAAEIPLAMQVSEHLWTTFQTVSSPQSFIVAGNKIASATLLTQFYTQRLFWPAWTSLEGNVPQGEALLQALREAEYEGLHSTEYHLIRLEKLLAEVQQRHSQELPPNPTVLASLDMLLSDAFLTYGRHLMDGRSNPERASLAFQSSALLPLPMQLQHALKTGSVAETLQTLLPPQPEYAKLRQVLRHYDRAAATGGWPVLPAGLHKGDRDARVKALRTQLQITGDLTPLTSTDDTLFDSTVEQAVIAFQKRHGLGATGALKGETLAFFNIPAHVRARQVAHNMERWRWLPRDLGSRHIIINIPAFTLDVIEHGRSTLSMRVVVGKPSWPTPVLSAIMTQVILSPTWTVPPSILKSEILPLLRQNPEYLSQRNMKIIKTGPSNTPVVLRQEPGPKNPLGGVKFLLPNRYQVYLHDTPSRALFAKPVRAFSHGCIRLERPIDLAEHVLREARSWSRARIVAATGKTSSQYVSIPTPIPVHLTYRTVSFSENGTLLFRSDIYSYDDNDKILPTRSAIALP